MKEAFYRFPMLKMRLRRELASRLLPFVPAPVPVSFDTSDA
jgi:hypothetical protein